ncbi:GtrA family protein [Streptomyces apocyni]|uniref:GtrA family protein n=1 Tax=Streptomyces apocyni TaxID=2654677 RepID=UPI0012EA779C|nr:GtrA family protein [Streptomyces apocyni]
MSHPTTVRPRGSSAPETAAAAAVWVPAPASPASGPLRLRRPGRARLRRLCAEVVRFGIVGGSGVGVNVLVFNLLLHGLGLGPMASTVAASCVAISTNYLGFRFFAYRDRSARSTRQIVLFFAFSGLGVAVESGLFYVAYHGLGMDSPVGSNIAKALCILLASAFRFLVYRTWVFQHDQP